MAGALAVPSPLQPCRCVKEAGHARDPGPPPASRPLAPRPLGSHRASRLGALAKGPGRPQRQDSGPGRLGRAGRGAQRLGPQRVSFIPRLRGARGVGRVGAACGVRPVSGAADIRLLSCDTHGLVLAERENKRRPGIFLPTELKALPGLPQATGSGGLLQEDQLFHPAPRFPSHGALDVAHSGSG